MRAGDGGGGDGGGFGAEDAGAEGDGGPFVLREEGDFFLGPAAFGADGEGERPLTVVRCALFLQCGGEGEGLLGFAEEDARGRRFAAECGGELGGVENIGDVGAAGLLGGFEGDATPAFSPLRGGEGEVLLGAAGEDGCDAGDAQLGGFFDGPLEAVELEDGEQEVDGEGCVSFQLFVEGEEDFGLLVIAGGGADFGDFGAVEEAVGNDVEELAGLGAEDVSEMDGLLAGEGGVGGVAR